MKILKEGCPSKDGFHMPAEYEPHKGTILIWPKRPGSWIYGAKKAREAFADVICATAESETVYLLVEAGELDHAQMIIEAVRKEKNYQKNYPVHYMEIASDDAWARDVGPTFVVNGQGQVRGIDWCFNAWGGICDKRTHRQCLCIYRSRTCGACVDGGSQRSAVSLVICRSCNIGKRDRCQRAEAHSPQSPGSGEASLYNGI